MRVLEIKKLVLPDSPAPNLFAVQSEEQDWLTVNESVQIGIVVL